MNAIECLVLQFDGNLNHPWESLESVLQGVTDEEALWQSPCYTHEEAQEGCPPPGTILWHIDHISGCNRLYAAVLQQRPSQKITEPNPGPPPSHFLQALEELRASHRALQGEVNKLQEAELDGPCGHGCKSVAEFLAACIRHEIWHAGQIALARRFYRNRTNG